MLDADHGKCIKEAEPVQKTACHNQGYFADPSDKQCKKCGDECKTCEGAASTCTSCQTFYGKYY